MTETFSPIERLEKIRSAAYQFDFQRNFISVGHPFPEEDQKGVRTLKYFSQAIFSGALPEPDTLYYIAYCINKYIEREGELTLDEAFNLESSSNGGTTSKKYAKNQKLLQYFLDIAEQRAYDPKLSILDAARKVIPADDNTYAMATVEDKYKKQKMDTLRDFFLQQQHQGK